MYLIGFVVVVSSGNVSIVGIRVEIMKNCIEGKWRCEGMLGREPRERGCSYRTRIAIST